MDLLLLLLLAVCIDTTHPTPSSTIKYNNPLGWQRRSTFGIIFTWLILEWHADDTKDTTTSPSLFTTLVACSLPSFWKKKDYIMLLLLQKMGASSLERAVCSFWDAPVNCPASNTLFSQPLSADAENNFLEKEPMYFSFFSPLLPLRSVPNCCYFFSTTMLLLCVVALLSSVGPASFPIYRLLLPLFSN